MKKALLEVHCQAHEPLLKHGAMPLIAACSQDCITHSFLSEGCGLRLVSAGL